MHGQYVWYELTTPDVEAAKKFYPTFLGWGVQPFDKDYQVWTHGGTPLGGIFRLNEAMQQQGVPPNWMPYIEAADVDAAVAKASSLGGSVIVPAADIPNTGRFAVLRDPQGAVFGVYKSTRPSQAWDGKPVIGRPSWHELATTDYAKAFAFYSALFGWAQTGAMDMGGGNTYFMYGKGEPFGGIFNLMPDMKGMPPCWLLYFHVNDVGKAVTQAVKAGAKVQRPQMDIPGGSIAVLSDPQGATFAVHHQSPSPAAATPSTPAKAPAAKESPRKISAKRVSAKKAKPAAKKAAAKGTKATKAKVKPRALAKAKAKPTATVKSTAKAKPKTKAKAKAKLKAKARPKARASVGAKKRTTTRRSARRR